MWRWAVMAAALATVACSGGGIPAGTGPSALYLDVGSGATQAFNVSECTATQANAMLVFTGGNPSTGDFSSRVQWTSDNPETLYVADGVHPYDDGVVYQAGTLLAIRPGAAQLRATYLEFTATAAVEVRALDSLRIEPQLTDLAERGTQQYHLYVRFAEGEPEQLVTDQAFWSFTRSTARAAVTSGTGVVTTNSASSDTLELSARLTGCARDARTSFRVSTVQALELDYEQGSELRLPVGYSEAVAVNARFATEGSTLQNVSQAVDIDGLDDDLLSLASDSEALYVRAIDASDTATSFSITLDSAHLTVQSKGWTPVETDLLRFKVTPEDLRLQYPNTATLIATGQFADGVSRPIGRHVTWSSNVATLTIGSGINSTAGELTTTDTEATAEVTATQSEATEEDSDSVVVRTYASSSPTP